MPGGGQVERFKRSERRPKRTCSRSKANRSSGRLPSSQRGPWERAPGPRSQPCGDLECAAGSGIIRIAARG